MRIYKHLLIGLLVLISLTAIFTTPSKSNLELFNLVFIREMSSGNHLTHFLFFLKYPPGVVALWSLLFRYYPLDVTVFVHLQSAWVIHKFILFFVYILTWISIVKLSKLLVNKHSKDFFLNISILFFFSVSVLQLGVSLAYFDILAVPFFIFSLFSLFKHQKFYFAVFYLLALSFSWSIVFLLPLTWSYFSKKNGKKLLYLSATLPWVGLILLYLNKGGMVWLLDSLSAYMPYGIFVPPFDWFFKEKDSLHYFSLATFMFLKMVILGFLFSKTLLFNRRLLSYLLAFLLFGLSLFFPNMMYLISLSLFTIYQLYIFKRMEKKLFLALLAQYAVYLLFTPLASEGNYIWLSVLSLIAYLSYLQPGGKYRWLLINIVAFFMIYFFFGISGSAPVKGKFFEAFKLTGLVSSMFLLSWASLSEFFGRSSLYFTKKLVVGKTKVFIILFLLLVNVSHIPASGDPDTGAWKLYSVNTIALGSPFLAHIAIRNNYPPLSTAIIGWGATAWHRWVGVDESYSLSTKIIIFSFFLITVALLFFLKKKFTAKKYFSKSDTLLIVVTSLALSLQTQGMADINIFILPPLFLSIYFLWREKYLLSGMLFGLALAIKWQPMVLIPLYGASLVCLKKSFRQNVLNLIKFLIGFLAVELVSWGMVIQYPGGWEEFLFTLKMLKYRGYSLSGQALNLNWIVTYIIHIFRPEESHSLKELWNLNTQIIPGLAPKIFNGYLFMAAVFLIVLRFWLFEKQKMVNFVKAAFMIFFSHHMVNVVAQETHLFYSFALLLLLYLVKPVREYLLLLKLFNVMVIMNLILFYGFTGDKWVNRLFFGFDLTIVYSMLYMLVYIISLVKYLRKGELVEKGY